MHKAHPEWVSLVVRSRDIGLTARVLEVLGLGFVEECLMDGIPPGCRRSYEDVKQELEESIEKRKRNRTDGDVLMQSSDRASEAIAAISGSIEQDLVSGNSSSCSDEAADGCDWGEHDSDLDEGD